VDHPHHIGLWFNYGDVNGTDFWNNSDAVKPEERRSSHHRAQGRHRGAQRRDKGELEVDMDWMLADGKARWC